MSVTAPTAAASSSPTPATKPSAQVADFNMFLKLLTTQMQHQDPLDPMDTSQYTQQLVQYSQVEQSVQQTGLLKSLLEKMSSADMAQASGLIGRQVEFDSAVSGLSETPARWSWSLPQRAASLSGEIVDSSGKTIASVPLDPSSTSGKLEWDGRLPNGARAPEGAYVLKIKAANASGASVPATIHSVGNVREVMQNGGELWLGIGGVSLPLSELTRVIAVA